MAFDNTKRRYFCNMFMFFVSVFLICCGCSDVVEAKTTLESIRDLVGPSIEAQWRQVGFEKEPDFISIRLYKYEGELEVWGGTNRSDAMKLIKRYPICAMDFMPGTKLQQGDEKTPEGSFDLSFHYSSRNWFMHMNLSPESLNKPGNPATDPAFYSCTDYPTAFDKALAKSIGIKNPGSAICLHGNCVSAGCASMQNQDYVEIHYWMTRHNIKQYGKPRVHILPFRYYEPCNYGSKNGATYDPTPLYSISSGAVCRTNVFIQMGKVVNTVVGESELLNTLGKDKIRALWRHIGTRESQFFMLPTPENAELNLSMDIFEPKQ